MSNIDPGVIDPGKPQSPPDGVPPTIDPGEDLVQPDDVREPDGDDVQPVEPDPEEGNATTPAIRT